MPYKYSRYIPFISLTGDFLILNLLFVAGFCLLHKSEDCFGPDYLLFYTYLNLCWLVLVIVFGAHSTDRNTRKKSILFAYIRIIVFFFFLFLMYFQVVPLSYYPREQIGYLFVLFFFILVAWKFLLYYAFVLYRRWGYNYRTVIILGRNDGTSELQKYFETNPWHGYRFAGFVDEKPDPAQAVLGNWSELKSLIEQFRVDEVYMDIHQIPKKHIQDIIATLTEFPVRVRIVPDLGNLAYKSAELITYGQVPVLQVHPGPLSYWYNRLMKRSFDVIFSLLAIVLVLSWLTPLIFLVSLISGDGSVFFRQKRTRIDGRVFTCLKYKTMKDNAQADTEQATRNDPRITPAGRWLRMFSLDELPQFFNVLMGDMSVVGPRPHMLKHTEEYRRLVKKFMLRHTVKPGITGLAQVNGYRGEITCNADIENRVRFDVRYIENWSFNLDLKIILITFWLIVRGRLKGQ